MEWALSVQERLLKADWPEYILDHPAACVHAEEDVTIFRGLRVCMAMHVGTPGVTRDPMTRGIEYTGPVVRFNFVELLTGQMQS